MRICERYNRRWMSLLNACVDLLIMIKVYLESVSPSEVSFPSMRLGSNPELTEVKKESKHLQLTGPFPTE
jgi:hypothetical protein